MSIALVEFRARRCCWVYVLILRFVDVFISVIPACLLRFWEHVSILRFWGIDLFGNVNVCGADREGGAGEARDEQGEAREEQGEHGDKAGVDTELLRNQAGSVVANQVVREAAAGRVAVAMLRCSALRL